MYFQSIPIGTTPITDPRSSFTKTLETKEAAGMVC